MFRSVTGPNGVGVDVAWRHGGPAMELLTVKLLAALGVIAITVIGGAIPLLAARRQVGWRFFSLGNAFAGGIFLGVGFIHLLPEGIHELEELVDYPLGALLAVVGVALLLLIDRVIFDHSHGHGEVLSGGRQQGAIYPYMLLVLLSIHSIAAGIALGLQAGLSTTIVIIVGILSHQGSESFAFVVSTHAAGLEPRRQKIMLAILALTVPVGILIGLAASNLLSELSEVRTLIEGGFVAFAAGTFIYVAIIDIIHEEFAKREVRVARFVMSVLSGDDDVPMPTESDVRVAKYGLIVAGIALMGVVAIFTHH